MACIAADSIGKAEIVHEGTCACRDALQNRIDLADQVGEIAASPVAATGLVATRMKVLHGVCAVQWRWTEISLVFG